MLGIKRITGAAGSAPEGEPGSWVSDAAREKFMTAYERVFALWPQPCGEFDIETATATTRVHACRPHPDGPPVVLLTGAGGNAAAWFPHVAALAKDHPVYGIDMPGDPNPSVPRALMTPPASCAAWLDELLGQLSDRPAHLVGFSYGGWVAMNQADPRTGAGRLHHAARSRRAHQARCPLLVVVLHRRLGRPDPDAAAPPPRPVAGQPGHAAAGAHDAHVGVGTRGYHAETKFPGVLTDDELRAITVPVLLITGARSAMLTPAETRARGALCRTRRSPSSRAATAASTGSTS